MYPSTDDHFQKKEQNGLKKFRDNVFTFSFENTLKKLDMYENEVKRLRQFHGCE